MAENRLSAWELDSHVAVRRETVDPTDLDVVKREQPEVARDRVKAERAKFVRVGIIICIAIALFSWKLAFYFDTKRNSITQSSFEEFASIDAVCVLYLYYTHCNAIRVV